MNTALQRVLLFGIVIVATGCDNVEWGGIDVSLRSPSESLVSDPPPDGVEVVEDTVSDGPSLGPVLYLGYRDGDQATLVPVAEIRPEGLFPIEGIGSVEESRSFAAEHLTPGLEFTLFSDGAQVGSFSAEVFSVDERYCRVRPQIRGHIELTSAAATVRKFLAVPVREGSELGYGTYSPVAQTTDLRNTSLRMALRVLRDVGVFLPGDVIDIRRGHPDVSDPARCDAYCGRYVRIRRRSHRRPRAPWSILNLPHRQRRRSRVQAHIRGLPSALP